MSIVWRAAGSADEVGAQLAQLESSVHADGHRCSLCVIVGSVDGVAQALIDHPGAGVVALVPDLTRRIAAHGLGAGASAVIGADRPASDVALAIHAVRRGYVLVPAAVRAAVVRPVLTGRQKQVLSLLVLGLSNAEIASRLHITESTVKMHVSSLLRLLEVRSRKEAIDLVLDPAAGLGTSIVNVSDRGATSPEGYGSPRIA